MGELKQESDPHIRQLSESEEKHLRLRQKQFLLQPYIHYYVCGWELESRDCGAIPGRGLLLTAERWIKGMCGRRLWKEMPVEESQAAMEARQYC